MTYQELLGCIFIIVSLTASYFIGWVRGVKYGFDVRSVTHTQNADEKQQRL